MPAANTAAPIRAASGLPAASCECCGTDPNPPNPGCCVGSRIDSSISVIISGAGPCAGCFSTNWPSVGFRSWVRPDFTAANGTWNVPLTASGPQVCLWELRVPNVIPFIYKPLSAGLDCSNLNSSGAADLLIAYSIGTPGTGNSQQIAVSVDDTGSGGLGDGFRIGVTCGIVPGNRDCYGTTGFTANPSNCCAAQTNPPACKTCSFQPRLDFASTIFDSYHSPGAAATVVRGPPAFADGFGPEDFA